jgi:FAD/FMN-containing dehydrogenase
MSHPLTGRVLYPGDPGFDGARHGFGARFDYDAAVPQAVVYAQNTVDVANAVKWARHHHVKVRVRAGAHSYEGYSSLIDNGIIIDVSEIETVDVDSKSRTAIVGAGIDMLELTERLCESGVGLPLATGPSVGLAGLVQGGGFGITSRRYGLTCDCVTAIEVVDAQGHIIRADAQHHSDLFWALRGGGGGNFGIVTSFDFNVQPMGMVGIFNIGWQWSDFEQVVDAWQNWSWNADWAFTSLLTLHVDGTVRMEGQYTADPENLSKLSELLMPMLGVSSPISVQIMVVPYVNAARMTFGVDPINPQWAIRQHGDNQLFKSCSAIASEPIPMAGIQIMKQFLENYPPLSAPPSQASMIQLLGGGGKAAEPATDATAVFHRKAMTVVQYDGYWTAPQDAQPTIDWTVAMRQAMLPYAHGAYVNYHDSALGPNWLDQYYGGNLPRLKEVKKKYDPDNFFSFPQSIPLP